MAQHRSLATEHDYYFDTLGRVSGYADNYAADPARSSSAVYGYDLAGRKTYEAVTYPQGFTLSRTYAYSPDGRVSGYVAPDGAEHGYVYDNAGRLSLIKILRGSVERIVSVDGYRWTAPNGLTLPGGSTRTFGYDELLRADSIESTDPIGDYLMDYSYGYLPNSLWTTNPLYLKRRDGDAP